MSAYIPSVVHETDFKKYLTGLLEGDVRVIKAVIDDLLKEDMPLNSIYRDFIQRSMYKVGVLWERNQIPVSIEHLAATATQVVVSDLYLKLQSAKENCPEVIIACVPNEQHDIGTMIVGVVRPNPRKFQIAKNRWATPNQSPPQQPPNQSDCACL